MVERDGYIRDEPKEYGACSDTYMETRMELEE